MSFLPPEGPVPELSTTRVSSGRSARAMAVAVVIVLIAVVGFNVVNRPAPAPPAPPAPAPTAPAVAIVPTPLPTPAPPRNQLEGNDGILGWAVVEQLAYLNADPLANYSGPRGPGLFNRCRWGFGPQGAPPRVDHDEAGCLGE